MRIGIISGSLYGGGSERMTAVLANGLVNRGNRVYLLTQEKREKEYSLDSRVKRTCVLQASCGFGDLLKDSIYVRRFADRHKLDVVLGMGIFWNLCVCMAGCGIHAKTVVAERNDPVHDVLSKKTRLLRKLLYPMARGFVFQTKKEMLFYSKRIQKRGFVIHNALSDNLPMRSDIHEHELVAIGRIMPQKNYAMMLRALKIVVERHPEYKLRIFGNLGDNQEKAKLDQLLLDLKLTDNVIFEGFCLDVHNKIKDSDIFIMTSDFEGMSNALMEAMAMGFPVVCTDCHGGGPRELIEDWKNGFLVPIGNVQCMAEKIIWLIEHPEEKEIMGKHAAEIRKSHGSKQIVKQWEKALE